MPFSFYFYSHIKGNHDGKRGNEMYEIINNSHSYAIYQCEEGFYDTNGGFYKKLLNSQVGFLNKIYYFEMERQEDAIILHIFLTKTDCSGNTITFTETETGTQCYKGGILSFTGTSLSSDELFQYAKNPEILVSYMSLILGQNEYYPKLLEFIEYYSQFKENMMDIYMLIYDMLQKGNEAVLYVFIVHHMFNMLIAFFNWYKKGSISELTNFSQFIQILKRMERISLSGYGPEKEKPTSLKESMFTGILQLIVLYGKENTASFIQFIEVIHQLNERSASYYHKAESISLINEAIYLLVEIKEMFPDVLFSKSTNFIIGQMFRTYEFNLTAEGMIDLIRIWKDYLTMKYDSEPIYPDDIKKSHDSIQNTYLVRLSAKQQKQFTDIVTRYKNLEYQEDQFRIIVPSSAKELSEVGNALQICVGSYSRAVVEKKTKILWLYTDQKYPTVVLEVRNNELVQAKMKRNKEPSIKEKEFIKKWCEKKELRNLAC